MKKLITSILAMQLFCLYAYSGQDRGGGNVLGGKLVESYITDIESVPEYKEIVMPIVKKTSVRNEGLASFLKTGFKKLTWYFIPTELKEQASIITGLPFSSNQIAVQNSVTGEVWVDATQFRSIDSLERAKLLVHESLLYTYNSWMITSQTHWLPPVTATNKPSQNMKMTRVTTNFIFNEQSYLISIDEFNAKLKSLGWSVEKNNWLRWDILCYYADMVDAYCSNPFYLINEHLDLKGE